jgi:hypothetical protein
MARFGRAFKRAAEAFTASLGPGQYAADGKKILCPHCGGDTFAQGAAQLNTAGMSFLNLDWANKSATTLVLCPVWRD